MRNKMPKKARSRAEILAEIAAFPPSIQGTISSYRCPRKNGPPAVYHNFQYTFRGKNHSMTIPVGMVADFKAADAQEIISSCTALKKARAPRPERRREDPGRRQGRRNRGTG